MLEQISSKVKELIVITCGWEVRGPHIMAESTFQSFTVRYFNKLESWYSRLRPFGSVAEPESVT